MLMTGQLHKVDILALFQYNNYRKDIGKMAVLTPKELLEKAKNIIGERDDDDALAFIEDLNDTISSSGDSGDDWKKKYEDLEVEKNELDKSWRQRYRDRFFSPDSHTDNDTNPANHANDKDDEPDLEEQAKKVRFDDLFKEEE